MNVKKYTIIIFMIIMLIPPFRVNADSGGYIVKFKPGCIPRQEDVGYCINADENIYAIKSELVLEEYKDTIEYAEPNFKVSLIDDEKISLFSTNEETDIMWQAKAVNSEWARKLGCYGNDVKIAVIDSGINRNEYNAHSIVTGFNYITRSTDVTDNTGHGSAVSNLIVAKSDSYSGIAPLAKIVPLKCFEGEQDADIGHIVQAIYDAVNIYNCKIINMSFGFTMESQACEAAVKHAIDNGVIVIASAGNDGNTTMYNPAAYDGVLGINAVDVKNQNAWFSQNNKTVDFTAPGDDVYTVTSSGIIKSVEGTSFSAPIVSALAAVAISVDEDIDNEKFFDFLKNSSVDLGEIGYDEKYGYGLVNTENMLNEILKDEECFLSPIRINEDYCAVITAYNNNQTPINAQLIWGAYESTKLSDTELKEISLDKNEAKDFVFDKPFSILKCFLWENTDSIRPLVKSRLRGD